MQKLDFSGLTQHQQTESHTIPPTIVSDDLGNTNIPPAELKRSQAKSVANSPIYITEQIQEIKKEIENALLAGGDTAILLLKACKGIAAITNDTPFYNSVESKLINLYGQVWNNPNLNEYRLANAWERYTALFADEIEQAKREHEKYIKRFDKNA